VPPLEDEFAGIASPVTLALALETLAIASEFGGAPAQRQLDKLRYLDDTFKPLWGRMGAVAEAFGVAYAAAFAFAPAIAWFADAVNAEDGSASLRAAEQYGNLSVRDAERRGDAAGIRAGIAGLERLAAVQSTIERENLLGSAWKRLSMVEWCDKKTDRKKAARDALTQTLACYRKVEEMARRAGALALHYPAKNVLAAEICEALMQERMPVIDAARFAAVGDALQRAATQAPDFWSVVGQTELLLLQALAEGRLAAAQAGAMASLLDLKGRVAAPLKWDSVANEARFTLVPYVAMAPPDEARAGRELMEALAGLARA
jgi:hypothetical protein